MDTNRHILKVILIAHLTIWSINTTFGQQTMKISHELTIGDTIPPIVLSRLFNQTNKPVKISELYHKGLLIIDFGATWCIPCIRELSELDTLSKKFAGKLSVLSVAYEDKQVISGFFKKHPEIDISLFSVITNDTLFLKYFPHKSLPHNIWIDSNGVIRAITGEEEITEKNILAFISGKSNKFLTKHDNMSFNSYKPYHLADTNFTYRSIFSGYNPEINSGTRNDRNMNPNNYMQSAFAWNCTVVDMFWLASFPKLRYTSQYPYYPRIEFHTKDSIRFIPEKYKMSYRANVNQWSHQNLFCYELILPKPVPDTVFAEYMLADLERNFNVIAKIEKRNQPCKVLTRRRNFGFYPSSKKGEKAYQIKAHALSVQNMTIDEFLNELAKTWDTTPIINESKIDYPVDFFIPFDKGIKLTDVIGYLEKCGFEFKDEVRALNKLILYDNSK